MAYVSVGIAVKTSGREPNKLLLAKEIFLHQQQQQSTRLATALETGTAAHMRHLSPKKKIWNGPCGGNLLALHPQPAAKGIANNNKNHEQNTKTYVTAEVLSHEMPCQLQTGLTVVQLPDRVHEEAPVVLNSAVNGARSTSVSLRPPAVAAPVAVKVHAKAIASTASRAGRACAGQQQRAERATTDG